MFFNICLIKPTNYIHSYAFLELGELIHFSLKELGCDSRLNFNQFEPGAKNILIGGHLLSEAGISQLPSSTVILNTEQVYGEATPWSQVIFQLAKKFDIWDYSKKNIKKFDAIGIDNVKHFGIGFQKELVRIDLSKNKDIDVLFFGSINERRKEVLDKLVANGLIVKVLFGVYGKERDEWVERSKIVLNHHFYNSHIFEVVRVFYLLTNSIAVVGEVNETTSIDSMCREGIYSAKYDELVAACTFMAKDDALRQDLQLRAINSISKYPQTIFTQEVIKL